MTRLDEPTYVRPNLGELDYADRYIVDLLKTAQGCLSAAGFTYTGAEASAHRSVAMSVLVDLLRDHEQDVIIEHLRRAKKCMHYAELETWGADPSAIETVAAVNLASAMLRYGK
jgi:hypothetical protein